MMTKAYDPREDWPAETDITVDTTRIRPVVHAVDIALNSSSAGTVVVDGLHVENQVVGVTSFAIPGRGPRVVLELVPGRMSIQSDTAVVEIDDATAELLKRLGWTPPAAPKLPVAKGGNDVQDSSREP